MDLTFACRCGTLGGTLEQADARDGCKLVCYCKDCRAAARYFDVLPALKPGGGSPLYQTLPARLRITRGADRLGCMRLSAKGLHRWYATCCGTPVANTGGSPVIPVAGVWQPLLSEPEALPGKTAQVFAQQADPRSKAPRRNSGLIGVVAGLVSRGMGALRQGRLREGPFFDADGKPMAVPHVLTETERRAAYAE